jgi:plastocyanin
VTTNSTTGSPGVPRLDPHDGTVRMRRLFRLLEATLGRRPVRLGAPLRLIAVAPALAMVVAACTVGTGATPGFTFPATPSPSARSSMTMGLPTFEPAPSATPAASGAASATPGAAGSTAATGATLNISALNIAFDTDHLDAPAGQPFVLEFANNDPGIPHNVEIKDATGASVFKGEIITGPAKASYQVPALAAGSYTFVCDVHPTMTGTLTVA